MKRNTKGAASFTLLLVAMAAVTVGGCSGKNKDPQMMAPQAGVTDVGVAPAPQPLEAPAPVAQPVIADTITHAPAPAAATGGKYTVQKGDTLWKIATASYGNGNQWQRIASANPGLTPATLKAGQTITIP